MECSNREKSCCQNLAAQHQEMLDNRPQREGGEILQQVENDETPSSRPTNSGPVVGKVPAEAGAFFLGRQPASQASTGIT